MKSRASDQATFSHEQSIFAGGVATVADARLIQETQFCECVNGYPARNGRVRKRPGFSEFDTMTDGIIAQYRMITEAGDDILLVWDDQGVLSYYTPGTAPTPTQLLTGLDVTLGIAHEFWHNDVLFSDGENGLYKVVAAAEDLAATLKITLGEFPNFEHIKYEAVAAGVDGNNITVEHNDPGTANQSLSVDVANTTEITVNLATDSGGLITSTIDDVVAAVNADAEAAALVTATGSGISIVPELAQTNLMFGADADGVYCYLCTTEWSFVHLARRQGSERLFGVQADDRTNLRYCEPFDPTSWPGDNVYSPGGNFLASAEVGATMVAFSDDELYRIDGTDPATWQTSKVASDGLGCINGKTVQVIEGIPVYLSQKGVAYYDGGVRPKPLSEAVFDERDPDRSIVPAWGDAAFALKTGSHYYLFYTSEPGLSACDRAVVYDFRMAAWGGPWKFTEETYTCGTVNDKSSAYLDTDGAIVSANRLTLGSASGMISYEDPTTGDDYGEPVEMSVSTRSIDGARPLIDKIFNDLRLGYDVSDETVFEVGLVAEDETTARTSASSSFTVDGSDAVRKRLPNVRARWARPYVKTSSSAARVEVFALGVDLFFCRPR